MIYSIIILTLSDTVDLPIHKTSTYVVPFAIIFLRVSVTGVHKTSTSVTADSWHTELYNPIPMDYSRNTPKE